MIIGYTTGVYDLFHVGHINLLRNAKSMCDRLIVGVTTDELVSYKGKSSVIPFSERMEIVRSCSYVDAVVPQYDIHKVEQMRKLKASLLFVGDDWYATEKWEKFESDLAEFDARVVYFPYTKGTSSTLINEILLKVRSGSI